MKEVFYDRQLLLFYQRLVVQHLSIGMGHLLMEDMLVELEFLIVLTEISQFQIRLW
jgi:hypothetical protein